MKQRGMTLIELMIVVAILAVLIMAVAPFTGSWVDRARVTQSQGILEQAIGQARSAALRNPAAVSGNAPASMLCSTNNKVLLFVPVATDTSLTCPDTTPPSQPWSNDIPTPVTLKHASVTWSCSCFNNKGMLTREGSCTSCSNSLVLLITSGSENETITFH